MKLDVGALTETVEVVAASTLVQTQSTAVTSTIAIEQLKQLPLVSRNALYSLAFLPGVETADGPRGAIISGLPNNTINITIDGISTGNQLQTTDGFFSMVTPRLDAIEEITVTGATPGAGGGIGSMQVAFTTRSGTNEFNTSIYDTIRDPRLNSNYYFNKINGLEKNDVRLHTYGGRVGGPIIIPGLYDGHNKAFFFFNMEHQYQPSEATRTRTILNPDAQNGDLHVPVTVGGVQQLRTVNLYTLAAPNGQTSTPDPFIGGLLNQIRQSTTTTGNVTTPAGRDELAGLRLSGVVDEQPVRADDAHRLQPDRQAPPRRQLPVAAVPEQAGPAEQRGAAVPGLHQRGLPDLVPDGRLDLVPLDAVVEHGQRGARRLADARRTTSSATSPRDMFENQGGYRLNFPTTITDPGAQNNPAPRNTPNYNIENTLSRQWGSHSLSMGGSFQRTEHQQNGANARAAARASAWITNFDPANAMFNTTNFPGASNAEPDRGAEHLRHPDRPHHQRDRHGASRREHRQVRLPRQPVPGVAHGLVRPLCAGLVARDADPDAELRPPLGRAAAVHAGDQHLVDVDARRPVRHVGHRHGPGGTPVQPVPAWHQPGGRGDAARLSAVRAGRQAGRTPTGTTSVRTSAWPGGRTCRTAGCGRCSAIRSRRRCAAATR